jgi:voltage-gated potassium channel Kch
MATPLLLKLHDYLQRKGKLFPQKMTRSLDNTDKKIKPDVIVCGFGRVGQIVCQMLDAKDIPYVAIDLDVNAVMMGREQGFNVVYGDATNQDVLREFGLQPRKVKSTVVALDNATTARKSILTIKSIAPRVKIFARARNLADSKMFVSEGVDVAMPETIESSFFIGYSVLEHIGVLDSDIEDLLHDMRQDDYDPDGDVEHAGGIPAYIDDRLAEFGGGTIEGGAIDGDLEVSGDVSVEGDVTAQAVYANVVSGLVDAVGSADAVPLGQMEKYVAQEIANFEGGVDFITDETLKLENGVLSVNTASEVEADNTLPITSAAVNTTVGNIEVLLKTI